MRLRIVAALLVGGVTASALAVDRRQDAQSPELFETFARYAFASYCPDLHDGRAGTGVCTVDAQGAPCEGFEGVATTAEFTGDGRGAVAGYVAVDAARRRIVVAVKGTDRVQELGTDAAIAQVDSDLCDGCKVHQGFDAAFRSIRAPLDAALAAQLNKTGQQAYRVVLTGHSLGAAVAMLAGAALRARGVALDMYLYGSPLTGDARLAAFVAAQPGLTARITNARDTVTSVPKRGLPPTQRYAHVFPEFWYEAGLALPGLYRDAQLRVCRGPDDCTSADCAKPRNGLLLSGCSLQDHGFYAGGTSFRPCGGEADALGTALAKLGGGGEEGDGQDGKGKS